MTSLSVPTPTLSRLTPITLTILILSLAALWLVNLGERKLNRPDEGRYTELSRAMHESGDWVTPRLNGLKYFEKPPLHYWASATFFHLPIALETKARLWSALTGLLAILMVFVVTRKLFDTEAGMIASSILASSLWFYAMGHLNTLDMGLTAFLSMALFAFLASTAPKLSPREHRNWLLLMWGCMGLAFLSKGLIGLVIPGATLFLYCLLSRDWRLLLTLHWGKGMSLLLIIVLPWMILAQHRNPEFFDFFIIHEHFTRFLAKGHQREGAWHYFIPLLLIGLTPWTFYLLAVANSTHLITRVNVKRLLYIWCGFILLFFSISKSKLPSYILPMFPALALLLAMGIRDLTQTKWRLGLLLSLGAALALMCFPLYAKNLATELYPYSVIEPLTGGVMVAGMVHLSATFFAYIDTQRVRAVSTLAIGFLLSLTLMFKEYRHLHPQFSGYEASERIKAEIGSNLASARLYTVMTYEQTLAPYLGRTLTMVQYEDEFKLGQSAEPDKHIPTLAGFLAKWQDHTQQYAVIDPLALKVLNQQNVPYSLVFTNPRFSFIKRLP